MFNIRKGESPETERVRLDWERDDGENDNLMTGFHETDGKTTKAGTVSKPSGNWCSKCACTDTNCPAKGGWHRTLKSAVKAIEQCAFREQRRQKDLAREAADAENQIRQFLEGR